MADSTIPNLVAVTVPALTDLFGVRQSGDTRDKKLTAAQLLSLGGDVTKVGTPVNNQIGVWTGDGTLEGDANFTWDGSHLLLPLQDDAATPTLAFGDGDTGFYENFDDTIRVSLAGVARFVFTGDVFLGHVGNAPRMMNEAPTATNPTFCPGHGDQSTGMGSAAGGTGNLIANSINCLQWDEAGGVVTLRAEGVVHGFVGAVGAPSYAFRLDSDTGIYSGGAGSDILSLAAGGVQIAQAKEASGANQFIIAPGVVQDAALTPSLAFGDGNTGFYESADNTLKISVGNAARWQFQANNFLAENSAGPFLFNTAGTSSSVPIMGPNRGDNNTGIGHGADDQLDFICGGLNCITIREVGAAREIGFYNTTPIAQQTGVAVTAGAIHAALVALGLITA